MTSSNNPLSVGEDLYVECEIGLDPEMIDYMRESHNIQIKIGAEPFYLWHRVDQGSLISTSITSWLTTSPQYSAYIWHPSDGEGNHPNARIQQNQFKVFHNSSEMTRVYDPGSLTYDNEYALETESGSDVNTSGAVRIWFNYSFTPGNVSYAYRNVCSCVDRTTGYPNRECPICRGTSYPAAFVQYKINGTKYTPADTILVRIPLAAETLTPEQIGRVVRRDLRHWMQATPYVNNFDVIMGTTGNNAGVLFEVVAKSDSKWRSILLHQEFNTVRIEETDIRYHLAPSTVAQIDSDVVLITSSAEIV